MSGNYDFDHEYDGIRYRKERNAPAIFRVLFYGIVVWGVIFIGYFLLSGWSSETEFRQKRQEKQDVLAKNAGIAPAAVPGHAEGKKEEYLALGKKEFAARCAACHGAEGKGGIGPDLTRTMYTYGRTEKDVTESIGNGRPNGMPGFGTQLSHEQLEGLVQFVLSLK
ncbi:MAG: cytochrome C [Desulfuromonadales bacterium]|nr:MAG: cytochrome C [Desulfuromonadales bacterium]